jgi:hypothetical protein
MVTATEILDIFDTRFTIALSDGQKPLLAYRKAMDECKQFIEKNEKLESILKINSETLRTAKDLHEMFPEYVGKLD